MNLFKKKLTEKEAAGLFVITIANAVKDKFPDLLNTLREYHNSSCWDGVDIAIGELNLMLCGITMGIQSLTNIFDATQAKRLEILILCCLNDEIYGDYNLEKVKDYTEIFEKTDDINNPIDSLSYEFLCDSLGNNVERFSVRVNNKDSGIFDPILIMAVSAFLIDLISQFLWKEIKSSYKLVPEKLLL